jgi:hypothetical protein
VEGGRIERVMEWQQRIKSERLPPLCSPVFDVVESSKALESDGNCEQVSLTNKLIARAELEPEVVDWPVGFTYEAVSKEQGNESKKVF